MIDIAIARTDLIDAATYESVLEALPRDRRHRAEAHAREGDRYASAVSFALLQYLWHENSFATFPEVVRGEFGKPRFAVPNGVEFNWSHDRGVCVCAVSPQPVGIDVQAPVAYSDSLFERIATPSELALQGWLRAEDDLSLLWTRKEAIVKRTGRGLSTPLLQVDTLAADELVTVELAEPRARLSVSTAGLTEQRAGEGLRMRSVQPIGPGTWIAQPLEYRLLSLAPARL